MEQTPAGTGGLAEWLKRNASLIGLVIAFAIFVLPHISPFETLNYYLTSVQRLSRWMLEKIQELFADYGYYLVFFGVLLENSLFLGFLVPGALILVLAGLAAENGTINIWWVLALGGMRLAGSNFTDEARSRPGHLSQAAATGTRVSLPCGVCPRIE